jgi:hypothetical protein
MYHSEKVTVRALRVLSLEENSLPDLQGYFTNIGVVSSGPKQASGT